jgi:hypothetical protein
LSLLPFVVIGAAILFFILKASGALDLLAGSGRDRPETKRRWGRELLENARDDPELNRRLQVFKDFLDDQSGVDDPSEDD